MFNFLDYLNINKTVQTSKENFAAHTNNGNNLSKQVVIISILINLCIAFLFILFTLDYINVIHPTLTLQNKSIYLILVYILLISNGFMFLVNIITMLQLIF